MSIEIRKQYIETLRERYFKDGKRRERKSIAIYQSLNPSEPKKQMIKTG